MIAIVREKVVICPKKCVRNFFYDSIDLFLGAKSEALEDRKAECSARRFELRFRPVHARCVSSVVAAIGILFAAYHNAGVE